MSLEKKAGIMERPRAKHAHIAQCILALLCLFLFWVSYSVSQTTLKYYGVHDIEPSQYSFLKDTLRGNFALVELHADSLTWQNALATAEANGLKLIIWPLGHGHQYTPWAWTGSTWDISEGLEALKYAERYITSGGEALLAVLMSHEPFYNKGDPFTSAQMKALYAMLKGVAPNVKLFVYMNDMAYYDQLLAPFYVYAIDDGLLDIAGIYKHHFGIKHTLEETLKEIDDDYALIQRKGLHMQLFFALQCFSTNDVEYRMPTAAEMLEYGTIVMETKKLDGVFWYPWDRSSTSYTKWLSKDRYDSTGADRWNVVTQLSHYLATTESKQEIQHPEELALSQNYPNPFNPTSSIHMSIPHAGIYALEIFNLLGQRVVEVFRRHVEPGTHSVSIQAGNLPTGIYIYTLTGRNLRVSKTMTVLK